MHEAFEWPLTTSGKIDRSKLLQQWLTNRNVLQVECTGWFDENAIRTTSKGPELKSVVDKTRHDVFTAILATRSLSLSKKSYDILSLWALNRLPPPHDLSFLQIGGDSLSAIEVRFTLDF